VAPFAAQLEGSSVSEQTIPGPYGPLPLYVAEPDGADPSPGVVVIHDAGGMTQDLREQADWLAGAGYLTVAPDLFSWGGTFRCIRQIIRDTRAGSGRSFEEIDAVRTWLAGQPGCTGRIGVIGFCMGGGFALLLAPRGDFDAASVNYGATGKEAFTERFLAGSCPIVASYGKKDLSLRGAADRLDQALTAIGVEHDVKEYPDANHSFMNNHVAGDVPVVFKVTTKLGMRYHEASAIDARRRIVAFFDAHLR
jgi:carboxymethylenebutenolidase